MRCARTVSAGYHRRALNEIYSGDVVAVDTFMHAWEGITAVYYLPGEHPAIIETGPGSSVERTLAGLREVGAERLDWIILTHIHLDHAGAVGHLSREYPSAKVVVRAEGAPHVADPSRLWASASRLYADMDKLWGEMLPVPSERIVAVSVDGPVADLGGGRIIEAHYAPGHAKHQMALLDTSRGDLFTGDALGVYFPDAGVIRPATPPPEFDFEPTLQTVDRLRALGAKRVFPTHFGLHPDSRAVFEESTHRFTQWMDVAKEVFARGGDAREISAEFRRRRQDFYPDVPDDVLSKFEDTISYDLNAAGMHRYLERSKGSV